MIRYSSGRKREQWVLACVTAAAVSSEALRLAGVAGSLGVSRAVPGGTRAGASVPAAGPGVAPALPGPAGPEPPAAHAGGTLALSRDAFHSVRSPHSFQLLPFLQERPDLLPTGASPFLLSLPMYCPPPFLIPLPVLARETGLSGQPATLSPGVWIPTCGRGRGRAHAVPSGGCRHSIGPAGGHGREPRGLVRAPAASRRCRDRGNVPSCLPRPSSS